MLLTVIYEKSGQLEKIIDWPSLIKEIRMRPAMWLCSVSIDSLESFLAGIHMSEIVYKIPKENRLSGFDFQAFQEWADKRYNPNRLSINVFHMAINASGDNVNALNKWFEWYDEFRNNLNKTEQSPSR